MFGFKKDFTFNNAKKPNNKSRSNYKKKKEEEEKKHKTCQSAPNPALQV